MAWNPTPEVAAARDIGNHFQKSQVILIMIDDNGTFQLATYGKTMKLCAVAAKLGDVAFYALNYFVRNLGAEIKQSNTAKAETKKLE